MKKIVTWNVNSLAMRLDRVLSFIDRESPDVLCLQEIKCVDEKFPYEAFDRLNYHCAVFGQKSYNGVAVISKEKPTSITKSFDPNIPMDQARMILCTFKDFHVASFYVPNGQDFASEKFQYKLNWLINARKFLENNFTAKQKIAIVGDFNITPDDRDVYDPEYCRGKIHCSSTEREALLDFMSFGLIDVFRKIEKSPGHFSWWDYRELSFPKNKGLRIDLILTTKTLAEKCKTVRIDRNERKGEKPSDHVPVIGEFEI